MQISRDIAYDLPLRDLTAERDKPARWWGQRLLAEPGARGRVLDIGCGGRLYPPMDRILGVCRQLDGVDPSDAVMNHPNLAERWHAPLEAASVPAGAYDMAYASYVLEHLTEPRAFFVKVRAVLRPGGVFWALTPNGTHPFCTATRLVQVLGAKRTIAERADGMNAYPAYYRANTAGAITRAVEGLGFESAAFYYVPSLNWRHYFPRGARWVRAAYDWLLGTRWRYCMLQLACRLSVPAERRPGL